MRRALLVIAIILAVASANGLMVFHDPNPASATEDSFVVRWTTDNASIGAINYGTSTPPTLQVQNNTQTKSHSILIERLQPNTKYYYNIVSIAPGEFPKIDDNNGDYYFISTRAKADNTPPRVTNITVESAETTAMVRWMTDKPSTTLVSYGERTPSKQVSDENLALNHQMQLEVTKNTAYVLVVGGCDASDNCVNATSGFFSSGSGMPLNVSIPEFTRSGKVDVKGNTVPGAEVRLSVNGKAVRAMIAGSDGGFLFQDVAVEGTESNFIVSARDSAGAMLEKNGKVVVDNVPPLVTFTQGIPEFAASTSLTVSGSVSEPVTINYGTEQTGAAPERVTEMQATKVTGNSVDLQWTKNDATRYAVYRNGVRVAIVNDVRYTDSVSAGEVYKYRVSGIGKGCQEGSLSETTTVQTNPEGLRMNITPQEIPLTCGAGKQSLKASGTFSFSIQLAEGENRVVLEFVDKGGNVVRISNMTTVDTVPPQFLEENLNQLSPTYRPLVEVRGKLNKQGTVFIYINDDKPIAVLTNKNGGFSKQIELSRDAKLKKTKNPISVTGEMAEGWQNNVKLEAVDLAGRKVTVGPVPVTYALCGYGSTFQITLGKPMPDVVTPRLVIQGVQQAGFSLNASYRGGRDLARQGTVTIRPLTLSNTEQKKYDHDMVRVDFLRDPRNPTSGYVQLTFQPQQPANAPSSNKTIGGQEVELSKHRLGECKVPGFGCVRLMLEVEVKAQEKIPKMYSGDPGSQITAENFLLNDVSQRTCVDVELQIDRAIPLSQNIPKKFLENSIEFIDGVTEIIDKVLDPMITVGTYTTYGCMAMNGVLFGMFFSERMSCEFASIQDGGIIAGLQSVLGKGNNIRDVAEIGMCESVFKDASGAIKVPGVTSGGAGVTQPAQDRAGAYAACKKCQDAISRRKSLEQKMRVVCDRVACPSAPTVQTYIKENQKTPPRQVKLGPGVPDFAYAAVPNNVQGLLYTGSSCSFKGQGGATLGTGYSGISLPDLAFKVTSLDDKKQPVWGKVMPATPAATPATVTSVPAATATTTTATSTVAVAKTGPVNANEAAILAAQGAGKDFKIDQTLSVSYAEKGVKEVYLDYLTHKKDKPVTEGSSVASVATAGTTVIGAGATKINCAGLHPSNPECCGYEYYQEWGSACGIPGVLETFDEIKESACLAAQNANRIPDLQEAASKNPTNPTQIQCKSLFNAVAGFCEPGSGMPVGDDIATGLTYNELKRKELAAPKNNEIYVRIEPVGADNNQYVIARGYIAERIARQRVSQDKSAQIAKETAKTEELRKDKTTENKGQFYLNAELDFVPDTDGQEDLSMYFMEGQNTITNADGTQTQVLVKSGEMPPGFAKALCVNAQETGICESTRARTIYLNIRSKLGITDKTYIVRPDRDGVVRSTQCMCLPAVTSYLTFWKNILGAVRNCFQTVKITGDASAGVCQAVLSQYVCDMLFDVLSCFTQKYSTPGSGTQFSGRGGIGDVLGSLSAAGGDMQRSINSRYGDTALWRSMFVERKLLHSVCAFAFTGTWDLDMSGMYAQTVNEIPIKSQGFLYPADRRFISYNPVTRPSGLPTFTYHFGVGLIAGDELRYSLELKCSNSLRCEPKDGFVSGKCDCFGRREQVILVGTPEMGSGMLKKNDILNTEVFYTIQGADPASGVRYDTAILSWESVNPSSGEVIRDKKEVPIHRVGDSPPNICQFDPLALVYRCNIGIGDYTGARFSDTPRALYPDNQAAFTTGKPLVFEYSVNLQYPSNLQQESGCVSGTCPYTKWVDYEIKNQQGQTVLGPFKAVAGEITSNSHLKVEANGETKNVVTTTWSPRSESFSFVQTLSTGATAGKGQSATFVSDIRTIKEIQEALVLVVTPTEALSTYNVEVFKAASTDPLPVTDYMNRTDPRAKVGEWGWWKKTDNKPLATYTIVGHDSKRVHGDSIELTIRQNFKLTDPAAEYYIGRNVAQQIGTTSTICEQFATNPANWTVTFSMFDSTPVAGGSSYEFNPNQPTVDPSTGDIQKATIPFQIVCADSVGGKGGSVQACPDDPTLDLNKALIACYCGNKAGLDEANRKLAADPTRKDLVNCGLGQSGNFCVYPDDDATKDRVCRNTAGQKPVPKTTTTPVTTAPTPTAGGYDSRILRLTVEPQGVEPICFICKEAGSTQAGLLTKTFKMSPGLVTVKATLLGPKGALVNVASIPNPGGKITPIRSTKEGQDQLDVSYAFTATAGSYSITFDVTDEKGAKLYSTPELKLQLTVKDTVTTVLV